MNTRIDHGPSEGVNVEHKVCPRCDLLRPVGQFKAKDGRCAQCHDKGWGKVDERARLKVKTKAAAVGG